MTERTAPVQFTCEHCDQPVPFMDAGLYHYEHRNHCPECLWSKHILFGTDRLPPCDQLMRPTPDISLIVNPVITLLIPQECPCGFRWVTYDENWWATLDPETQTTTSNTAWTQTQRQNDAPTTIYTAKPLYATQPPPIPPQALHTRTRVKTRP
jgi:hypothetical protein